VKRDQRCRRTAEPGEDVTLAGKLDSLRGHEVAPEVRAARPAADDLRDVVVPAQQAVGVEVEGLPPAVGVPRGR
jgi:hypothetical protein